jgi:SdrD B-like domain
MMASLVTSSTAQAQAAGVAVGDFVWNDLNGDGLQDAGEPGLAGVVVSIAIPGGGPVLDSGGVQLTAAQLSTVTSSTGAYSFSNLDPGQYRVLFTLPAGYVTTLSTQGNAPARDSNGLSSLSALLLAGQSDTSIDLGLRVNAVSVGDFVWDDLNGDGLQDAGEPGLPGVGVSISKPGGGVVRDSAGVALTAAQLSTVSSGTGAYGFSNLEPDQYRVTFTLLAGYVTTLSTQGNAPARDSNGLSSLSAVLTPGQSDTSIDLGLRANAVSVGDFVWDDLNQNGLQDVGEPGIGGVVVTISKPGGGVVRDSAGVAFTAAQLSTISSGTGAYGFSNLEPDQYRVTFTGPTR